MRMQNCTLMSDMVTIKLTGFGFSMPNRLDMEEVTRKGVKKTKFIVTNKQATARIIFYTLYGYTGSTEDIAKILSVFDLLEIKSK